MGVGNEGASRTSAAMTLALAPSSSAAEDELCTALSGATEGDRAVLFVALTRSATGRLDSVSGVTGDGTTTLLRVGGPSSESSIAPSLGDDVDVRSVADPTNLTRLGVAFTEWLAETGDATPVVCFHSLDAMLQYVGTDRLFRFFSVLSDHLQEAGAVAHVHADPLACEDAALAGLRPHVHADPLACEDAALAVLRPLFTEVVEHDEPPVVE